MKTRSFIIRLVVSVILLQSLYFKFTAHAEAVHIFSTLGAEPWGRLSLAVIELVAGIGLLLPKTHLRAAFLTMGLMLGAVGVHLFTEVGIQVKWDGITDHGQLFTMAIIAFIGSVLIQRLYIKRNKISTLQFVKEKILI